METVGPTMGFANAIDNVPQLKAAIKSPQLNPDPHFRAFVQYAQGPHIGAFPVTPVSADYANSLTTIENLVLHGKMTPKQGLDKVTQRLANQARPGSSEQRAWTGSPEMASVKRLRRPGTNQSRR